MRFLVDVWFLVFFMAAIVSASSFADLSVEEWNEFKAFHGKAYSTSVEEEFRKKIYLENKLKIAEHNHLAQEGHRSYFLKMNHFGDFLPSEIAALHGLRKDLDRSQRGDLRAATFIAPEGFEAPTEIDWRSRGAVTEVRDQGKCGSCYAMAATGSLEGQHFRKTGKLITLSVQQIVDCVNKYEERSSEDGCGGGNEEMTFKYIQDTKGIDTERSYPYVSGKTGVMQKECHFNKSTISTTETGWVLIPGKNEDALALAVAAHGPITFIMDASSFGFNYYSHGIYSDDQLGDNCSKDAGYADHVLLIVGYGPGYWLVKNSWGTDWGMEGYVKIKRGVNMCGIANEPIYPLV